VCVCLWMCMHGHSCRHLQNRGYSYMDSYTRQLGQRKYYTTEL